MHEVFSAYQPVTQHFEKSGLTNFRRGVEVAGERAHCAFVDLEKQSVFTAEVLEDGAFRDTQRRRDIADSSRMVSMLRKMIRGGFDDAGPLRLGTGTQLNLPLVERWCSAIAGDSRHR